MGNGGYWDRPRGERRRMPADYERAAAAEASKRRQEAAGSASLMGAADDPAIVIELRKIPLGDNAPSVPRSTAVTGFAQKHGETPILDTLVDDGDLKNN